jgi:uncharacterized protein YciI
MSQRQIQSVLFAILIFDEPGSDELRDRYRQRHLEYLKEFDEQTLFAGPITTDPGSEDLGSFRLIRFTGREAALKHIKDEPYVIGGIQKRWQIHRWEASLAYSWRNCPRARGNIQVLFHGLDKPGSGALRRQNTPANLAYLEQRRDCIMARGPLLTDDGETQIGSIFLADLKDLESAREFIDNMPFNKVGLYHNITFHRWRFGRVFDRFTTDPIHTIA